MDTVQKTFENPPAAYRSAPLWVWNDDMTEPVISAQLNALKAHGFGGAFVHPRPGMITEYLSTRWFALWEFALQTAQSLDMKLYIYDENSYPSGFAGGLVPSQNPDCLARGMSYRILDNPADLRSDTPVIRAFTCRRQGEKMVMEQDITLYPRSQWQTMGSLFFVVTPVEAATTGWLAGFAYVDLMRPETTRLFLETTHEAYFRHFGNEFGRSIPALFTDEPNIAASGVCGEGSPALPFSYWLAHEFELQHGYSLLEHLPCVFKNVQGEMFEYPAQKVRYDYYTSMHTLWVQNSIQPISRWCADHGIAWTGHYLEHQWPLACGPHALPSPSVQSHYEYHQWPAIDMLLSSILREEEINTLMLTIQEVRSAANQFRKERTLCELYGAGGWDSTFEDYKRLSDWVMVNGINFINQHLTYSTIAGARKRDHPQSFDWREPWWDEYTQLNDYIGRTSYLLSQGVMRQRILLLNPSTTGYLIPYEEEDGFIFADGRLEAMRNPNMTLFLKTLQQLTDQQWDYDLGDEYTLERHGAVKGDRLAVGAQCYDVVIISGDMKNMRGATAQLLRRLLEAGGRVVACGEPGPYIDGLEKPEVYAALAEGWRREDTPERLHAALLGLLDTRITSSAPWVTGVTHMRRELEDGRALYFFVNHHRGSFETTLSVPGRSLSQWNLFTGEAEAVEARAQDGRVWFDLKLARNQSALFVTDTPTAKPPAARPRACRPVALNLTGIRVQEPNSLPISYCDLSLDGKTYRDVYVLKAAELIYNARGFASNPWDNKVQFKNNIINRNHFGDGSGFEAAYHFFVGEDYAPAPLYAVAEHPALCRLRINGHPVEWSARPCRLDHHFGMADIGAHVRAGENTVTLIADRFDVRLELETLYLQGSFGVGNREGRWVLTVLPELAYGPWKDQGAPFYSGGVLYEYRVNLEEAPQTALLEVTDYRAAALSLYVNGAYAGLVNADGVRPLDIGAQLGAGENHLALRVCPSLKNLMGPHFMKNPVRGSAWPSMWKEAPAFARPRPEEYDLLEYGLTAEPKLILG